MRIRTSMFAAIITVSRKCILALKNHQPWLIDAFESIISSNKFCFASATNIRRNSSLSALVPYHFTCYLCKTWTHSVVQITFTAQGYLLLWLKEEKNQNKRTSTTQKNGKIAYLHFHGEFTCSTHFTKWRRKIISCQLSVHQTNLWCV